MASAVNPTMCIIVYCLLTLRHDLLLLMCRETPPQTHTQTASSARVVVGQRSRSDVLGGGGGNENKVTTTMVIRPLDDQT